VMIKFTRFNSFTRFGPEVSVLRDQIQGVEEANFDQEMQRHRARLS
jgi:hypothetical protein